MKKGKTTAELYKSTRARLIELKLVDGESYDSVINRLIDHWNKTHKKEAE